MALGTNLPVWPAVLFGYLEPVALIMGWQVSIFDPERFSTAQVPNDGTVFTPSLAAMSYQLGNIFILLLNMAVLALFISREARVSKWYLAMVAFGDIGHIYSCYVALGPETFFDFANYNDMMWGNIGFSAFLFVNRVVTLLGLFGKVQDRLPGSKVKRG